MVDTIIFKAENKNEHDCINNALELVNDYIRTKNIKNLI